MKAIDSLSMLVFKSIWCQRRECNANNNKHADYVKAVVERFHPGRDGIAGERLNDMIFAAMQIVVMTNPVSIDQLNHLHGLISCHSNVEQR